MSAHRKPLSVLEANGSTKRNPARYRERADAAVCPGGIGEPPVHLSQARKTIWAEIVAQLPEGHLQSADRFLLEIVTDLAARQQRLLLQGLAKLGLTPLDRNRVQITPKPVKPENDPWAQFA
jgi:phage terminase small subunit